MSTLVHLDASVRQESLSRYLSRRFAERWEQGTPGGTVSYRDLAATPLPHVSRAQVEHLMYGTAGEEESRPEEVVRCERLVDEVRQADLLLLGTPMYNFTIPSTVKAWIDHITWPGLSFDPASGQGLLDTPAVVVISRGGAYGPSTPRADFNFQEPYLQKVLGFVGIGPVEFVTAELRLFAGEDSPDPFLRDLAEKSLAEAISRIDKLTPVP